MPASSARRVKSRATPAPPMVSTTMSTSGSDSIMEKSLTNLSAKGLSGKSRTSRIYFNLIKSLSFREMLSSCPVSTSATPDPTVPKPKIATLTIISPHALISNTSARQHVTADNASCLSDGFHQILYCPVQAGRLHSHSDGSASSARNCLVDGKNIGAHLSQKIEHQG